MKTKYTVIPIFFLSIMFFNLAGSFAESKYSNRHKKVFHPNKPYCLTHFEIYQDTFFIVDCYNNRVIYSKSLNTPINKWHVLADDLSWPHSIATDGEFFVIDDSYADRVVAYKKTDERFELSEEFKNIGKRPHRVRYDPETEAFYVLWALSSSISKLANKNGRLELLYTKHLPFLNNAYTRSFNIIDGNMYFVSGPGKINVSSYIDNDYKLISSYAVPDDYKDMIDIIYTQNRFFITSMKSKVLMCNKIGNIENNSCEDIFHTEKFKGIPYYFTLHKSDVYVTTLGTDNILKFISDGYRHKPKFLLDL